MLIQQAAALCPKRIDIAELTRGKTGRVYGTLMGFDHDEGLPLSI